MSGVSVMVKISAVAARRGAHKQRPLKCQALIREGCAVQAFFMEYRPASLLAMVAWVETFCIPAFVSPVDVPATWSAL